MVDLAALIQPFNMSANTLIDYYLNKSFKAHMINKLILEKLASQIGNLIPEQASQDVKNNIQQLLARQLNKLDLVSRDEFEAQQAVLLRTREKLEALEKLVKEMEEKLS